MQQNGYSDDELAAMTQDLESDLVERKRSLSTSASEKIARSICAFANDLPGHRKPGVIFVGVEDDGRCAGLMIDDEILKRLADMRGHGQLLPRPSMDVQRRTLGGCDVATVTVQPSPHPPVRYEGTHAPARLYWYSGRVEIESPGGLFGAVTPETLLTGATAYRNQLIAEIMVNLGYAQRFGFGIPLALRALRSNGNPEPDFQIEHHRVRVAVESAP